jgi:valyl-tRNA synthetase
MTTPGRNVRLSMERIEGYRNFINKLWNASRFALMNLAAREDGDGGFDPERFVSVLARAESGEAIRLSLADRWILSRLQRAATAVDEALSEYRFSEAANTLYHFLWHEVCDWYIELAKAELNATGDGGAQRRFLAQGVLSTVLERSLRLLHPFCPFVTEEIWQKLPRPSGLPGSLMVTVYAQTEKWLIDDEAEREMELLQEVAVAIRTLRSTYGVPPAQEVAAEIRSPDAATRALLEQHRSVVERSARVRLTLVESGGAVPQSGRQVVRASIEVVVPLAGLVDIAAESARIQKEIGKADKEIAQIEKKLGNEKFLANAPAEVVEEQRTRLKGEQSRRQRLGAALEALRP